MSDQDPLIILNPVAGLGDRTQERNRGRLRKALRRAGLPDTWVETSPERDAGAIILEEDGSGTVIVLGGDGTVQAAARALRGTGRPMAIVPRGTGNVVAQRLGLPLGLGAALRVAREGVVHSFDLGDCNDQPVLLAAGMGVDGRLIRDAHRELKNKFGVLAYLWSAFRNFPARHHDFTLELDGYTECHRAASVVVANLGTQVGPWIFPPEAHADDARLDVVVIRMANLAQVLHVLASPLRLRWRKRSLRGVYVSRAADVRVRCRRALPLQVDGEDMGDVSEFAVQVQPGSLAVLLPQKRASRAGMPGLGGWKGYSPGLLSRSSGKGRSRTAS